ncbi:MAG: hypothetical protein WB500_17065, partial [Rhodoplanes sp.]
RHPARALPRLGPGGGAADGIAGGAVRGVSAVVMQRSDNILGVLKSPTTEGSATFDLRPGAETGMDYH